MPASGMDASVSDTSASQSNTVDHQCESMQSNLRRRMVAAGRLFVLPVGFYFLCFCALTYPAIQVFSTAFFTDEIDGLQNVWNIWWVNRAITQLHTSPWHTTYLHYPYGTSLIGQTLNPFNGFLGIPLIRLLNAMQTYNSVVIFSYTVAGLTMFWLAYEISRHYFGSIVSGYVYTFSNYHLIHTQGHLQLVSFEWIPLFLLAWWILISRPRVRIGLCAAIALALVILCDFYYYFYCVLAGCILLGWRIVQERGASFLWTRPYARAGTAFVVLSCILTGPLVLSLLITDHVDPLFGSHNAGANSLDLLAPFIPNRGWRFANLTQGYWGDLTAGEQSVYVGASVTLMLAYVWIQRRHVRAAGLRIWFLIVIIFATLSLGPMLHIWGNDVALPFGLPYTWLSTVIPPLSVSGVPSRMIVMSIVSASVIYAIGLRMLSTSAWGRWIVTPVLLLLLAVEYLPSALTTSAPTVPGYVRALQSFPDKGAVIDMAGESTLAGLPLYYQTLDSRPRAFGYISRTPSSVMSQDSVLKIHSLEMRNDLLYRTYRFRYLVVPADVSFPFDPLAYRDADVKIYRLGLEQRRVYVQSVLPLLQGEVPAGSSRAGSTLGQTFTATRNGLVGIGLYLVHTEMPARGLVTFHLQPAHSPGLGPDIVARTISASTIADGYLTVISFPALVHSQGRHYYLYLSGTSTSHHHSVVPWSAPFRSYSGGEMMIDHRPVQGTCVMQLFYSRRAASAP